MRKVSVMGWLIWFGLIQITGKMLSAQGLGAMLGGQLMLLALSTLGMFLLMFTLMAFKGQPAGVHERA